MIPAIWNLLEIASHKPQTDYGFSGEYYGDSTQLLYLRARYYNPADGRLISRDTWGGDVNNPLSLNRWNYARSNPINYTDPSGHYVCTDPLPASCQVGLVSMHATAGVIKELVRSGAWEPVFGFSILAGFSQDHYFSNIRDLVWAMTIVLGDMDANRGDVWRQGHLDT